MPYDSTLPAIDPSRTVRVIARPCPFKEERIERELPAGITVDEIVDLVVGLDESADSDDESQRKARALKACAHVVICDREMRLEPASVPVEWWRRVRPKPGMAVTITMSVPKGGDGGGKSVLGIVLTLAVIAAAAYLGPLAAGLAFEVGSFGFAATSVLVSSAVPICGPLLVGAIDPPEPCPSR